MRPLWWIAAAFLAVQILLVCFAANGPFVDEGLYTVAGLRVLEGRGLSDGYVRWFNGSPFVWPVLAALGHHVAGLAGARLMAAILSTVIRLYSAAGLLRFTPSTRVAAQLFWAFDTTPEQRTAWTVRASSLVRARAAFGAAPGLADLAAELDEAAGSQVGAYLIEELAAGTPGFVTTASARTFLDRFHRTGRGYADDLRGEAQRQRA